MATKRKRRNPVRHGVSIGVPRYGFDPKAGDTFYVEGKTATVKSVRDDYVTFKRPVNGMTAMSVSNLYQVARVPESSRFAPYGSRSNPAKSLPRDRWISAKIRVTKSGKIQAKIKR